MPENLFGKGKPATFGATKLQIILGRLKYKTGLALNFIGVSGFVKPTKIYDRLTNTNLEVVLGGYFTIIKVNGKDFYFSRFSGEYDGSGMGVSNSCTNNRFDPPPKG